MKVDISSKEATETTLEGILSMVGETQAVVAKLAAGKTAEVPMTGGLAGFQSADGSFRLVAEKCQHTVKVDGQLSLIESETPGLLDHCSESVLSAEDAATVRRYRGALAEVNALARMGYRGLPKDEIGALIHAAETASPALRGALTAHAKDVAGAYVGRHQGRFASSTSNGSGSPGYNWIADAYLPDVADVTDQSVGLYGMLVADAGGPGLHDTASIKLRVLTGTGGMVVLEQVKSNTVGTYPLTDVATTVLELTGKQAVHSSVINAKDIRNPREALDWLALHQRAGRLGMLALADYLFFHGDKQTTAASHAYAAAGLAALALDHRDTASAGGNTDPLLLADGLRTFAVDRSTTVDLATTLSVAATATFSTQANALASHKALRAKLGDQYKAGSVYITTQSMVDAFAAVSVGVNGTPFFRPMTEPGNPWMRGVLYDGTKVYAHFGVSNLFNASGAVAAASALSAICVVDPTTILNIRGPDHGRVEMAPQVNGNAYYVSTLFEQVPWLPVPTSKKPVAFAFNTAP